MPRNKPKLGRRLKNISKKAPINSSQSKVISNREIALREFNPDYDMMLKKVSTSPNSLGDGNLPTHAS